MNARQRRYLVASLKSLSVISAATCGALLLLGWIFSADPRASGTAFSPVTLTALLLASGVLLWLAHFVTLGHEVRLRPIVTPSQPLPRKFSDDCPTWPTILAWLVTDLNDDDAHRISTHVSACENCRRRLALMNAVQEMSSDRRR